MFACMPIASVRGIFGGIRNLQSLLQMFFKQQN